MSLFLFSNEPVLSSTCDDIGPVVKVQVLHINIFLASPAYHSYICKLVFGASRQGLAGKQAEFVSLDIE